MLFMTTPAGFFECAVIAEFVLVAPSDWLMAVKTLSIGMIPGVIVVFVAVVRNVVPLVSLGNFIRRYHNPKDYGDRYRLG